MIAFTSASTLSSRSNSSLAIVSDRLGACDFPDRLEVGSVLVLGAESTDIRLLLGYDVLASVSSPLSGVCLLDGVAVISDNNANAHAYNIIRPTLYSQICDVL